ncbi:MAG: hypothetical protein WEA09_07500 [Gemmatimonadota bacterium]
MPSATDLARSHARDPRTSQEADLPLLQVLYEHPQWFASLFQELDHRGVEYQAVHAGHLHFPAVMEVEPASSQLEQGRPRVVFNRMSPSAYLRGGSSAIRFTLTYLEALEDAGVRVINGVEAYRTELSKARQLGILGKLGLSAPRTRLAHTLEGIRGAAHEVGYPLVLKPNVGGSGAGIIRVNDSGELEQAFTALTSDTPALQVDSTVLVQEFVAPRGNSIVRVEVVGGRFLYAIRIHLSGESFNLCPADVCGPPQQEMDRVCPAEAPDAGLQVEAFTPPPEVVTQVERIVAASGMELGGVEYLEREESGEVVFYDVNALSNFVADPMWVLGFDPTRQLVDFVQGVLNLPAAP